jgi:hypothetical protein
MVIMHLISWKRPRGSKTIHIWKTELMENGNFSLFAANGKRTQQTSICCKWKLKMAVWVFLVWQTINKH